MLKNWNHDLVQELSEVSDGLWRMDEYLKNSDGCEQCIEMWKKVQDRLESVSADLVAEINRHSQQNRFD